MVVDNSSGTMSGQGEEGRSSSTDIRKDIRDVGGRNNPNPTCSYSTTTKLQVVQLPPNNPTFQYNPNLVDEKFRAYINSALNVRLRGLVSNKGVKTSSSTNNRDDGDNNRGDSDNPAIVGSQAMPHTHTPTSVDSPTNSKTYPLKCGTQNLQMTSTKNFGVKQTCKCDGLRLEF